MGLFMFSLMLVPSDFPTVVLYAFLIKAQSANDLNEKLLVLFPLLLNSHKPVSCASSDLSRGCSVFLVPTALWFGLSAFPLCSPGDGLRDASFPTTSDRS